MGNLVGWAKVIGISWLGCALVLLVGCGGSSTGSVSGKVTFQNKPVVCGSVTIIGSDKKARNGAIQPDGTYTVEKVAVGEAQVGVMSPNPNIQVEFTKGRRGKGKGENTEPTAKLPKEVLDKWVPISRDYDNPEKSGLSLTIAEGENTFNIVLTKAPKEDE